MATTMGPQDHINVRILHSGAKTQDNRASRHHAYVCVLGCPLSKIVCASKKTLLFMGRNKKTLLFRDQTKKM